MKHLVKLSVVLALSVAAPALSHAQSGGMKGMDMKGMDMKGMDMKGMDMKGMESAKKAPGAVHKGAGTVKNVDSAKGTVTIAHDPVKSLNWPAMTMDFEVRDKSKLAALKPGQKIEFEFVEEKGKYTITGVK